jgi:hypothetical protein
MFAVKPLDFSRRDLFRLALAEIRSRPPFEQISV